MTVALAVGAVAMLGAGVTVLHNAEQTRLRSSLATFELHFPRELEAEAVVRFLAGLTGLLVPWWRRWLMRPFVVLSVVAASDGVRHRLEAPEAWATLIENALQASLPAVRYERIVREAAPASAAAAEYRLSTNSRLLRTDAPSTAAKLLTSLQPLGDNERIEVTWLLTPSRPVAPARTASSNEQAQLLVPENVLEHAESVAALRSKQQAPLLHGVLRTAVSAASTARARQLLREVEASWHETRAAGVQLHRHLLRSRVVEQRMRRLAWPRVSISTFNVDELAGLIGWPIGVQQIPGIVLSGYRQLAPSPLIPTVGTVIGDSLFPGPSQPLALDVDARMRHVHVIGPTGVGKSVLLANIAVQDLRAGYGVVLLDPKGDLVQDVLERVPLNRRGDVVVLDPADPSERAVGLNPLHVGDGVSAETVVENLVGLMKQLYSASWGPRTDDILRASLMALVMSGQGTLCEVPLLLTNAAWRKRLVASVDDPLGVGAFFAWYDRLSASEQLTMISPVLNKVRAFTMRPRVRGIIGQATPALNMSDALQEGKVVLVSLATGLLGEEAAALLGSLVVAELWHATTARAAMRQEDRRPVMAILDEFQHFLQLPTPMATVLAEARGLKLGCVLAHQFVGQLHDDARSAVLGTVRSRVSFQLSATDARLLAREFGGVLTADDLQGLGAYELAAQLFAAGATQPAVTAKSRPLPTTSSDAEALRAASRQRFGRDRQAVDAEILARQQLTPSATRDAPVGRRPRRDSRREPS
jgi:hypothetical protein